MLKLLNRQSTPSHSTTLPSNHLPIQQPYFFELGVLSMHLLLNKNTCIRRALLTFRKSWISTYTLLKPVNSSYTIIIIFKYF